ncbi:MAG: flagellar hook-basal body protein [Lachnospiraceae bacterium]|nr:flagellar hook-basal body protein [Lachnospiraceae bacterium]
MIRSLWSAASGMIAQQNNVDVIANNLANVNTTGYKTEANEFKSLLYQTIQTSTTTANGEAKPIAAQVGLGVRNVSVASQFSQGSLQDSDSNSACAIDGNGFFAVRGTDGNNYYTRNGDFVWAVNGAGGISLTTSEGLPVLNTSGTQITLGSTYISNRIQIGDNGVLMYPDADGNLDEVGQQIGLWQFQNPKGLEKIGSSLYQTSAASGDPLNENTNNNLKKSSIIAGYLEASNVQIATEMVNLIIAQRAYESNAKAITTSDDMMQLANQLKS